ncbi:MAG: cytochrome P450, partial [Pseudomonadota bacterium]
MSNAPVYEIDPQKFWRDPYPDLKSMRENAPIAYVPQLDATLLTKRDDIFVCEKNIECFSSDQPEGLMTVLMGQNLMRKDGSPHMEERKVIFPTVSPKTVKMVWAQQFEKLTEEVLDRVYPLGEADIVKDVAMPISAEALKAITGLTNMSWQEMDRVSQGMIDGCANYAGDRQVEERCHDCTASIDRHIDERIPELRKNPDSSLLSVQLSAGLAAEKYRANIKLAISGGQNEPRDVIGGLVWTMLTHRDQMALISEGKNEWIDAFEEYVRWISPIGMSPRRMAQEHTFNEVTFDPEDRVFLMFGSANRDEEKFDHPDRFDMRQDNSAAIAFG